MARICIEAPHFGGDRPQNGNSQISQSRLELRELLAAELRKHVGLGAVGKSREDADEIIGLRPALQPLDLARKRVGIGLGLADLARDGIGIVGEIDARQVGWIRLRHLLGAVLQAHDPRRRTFDQWLDHRKIGMDRLSADGDVEAASVLTDLLFEIQIELHCDIARQFEMLLLVITDRNMGGAVDHNVGGHQARIGEKTEGGVLAVLSGLVLELGHPVHPADPGDAVEDPGEFSVLRNS